LLLLGGLELVEGLIGVGEPEEIGLEDLVVEGEGAGRVVIAVCLLQFIWMRMLGMGWLWWWRGIRAMVFWLCRCLSFFLVFFLSSVEVVGVGGARHIKRRMSRRKDVVHKGTWWRNELPCETWANKSEWRRGWHEGARVSANWVLRLSEAYTLFCLS